MWRARGELRDELGIEPGDEVTTIALRDLRDVVTAVLPHESRVIEATRIKAAHPMAHADAFAAATAIAHDATLWTGDPELLVSDAAWRWRDLR